MDKFKEVSATPQEVREWAAMFQDKLKVSNYEAFSLALKVELNSILKKAFVISSTDAYPNALEEIAIIMKEKE